MKTTILPSDSTAKTGYDFFKVVDDGSCLKLILINESLGTEQDILFKGAYEYAVLTEFVASLSNIPSSQTKEILVLFNDFDDFDFFGIKDVNHIYGWSQYIVYSEHSVAIVIADNPPSIKSSR